jgi:hypothetical protein
MIGQAKVPWDIPAVFLCSFSDDGFGNGQKASGSSRFFITMEYQKGMT